MRETCIVVPPARGPAGIVISASLAWLRRRPE